MKQNRRYYIYKYVYRNQIIYIGKTHRPLSERIYEHSKEEKFMRYPDAYVLWFEVDSLIEMDVAEKILIATYKPELNVVDNDDSVLKLSEFTEPAYQPYAAWSGKHCFGKHFLLYKEQQMKMLKLQLQDLDLMQNMYQNLNDWISYVWDLYLDMGWNYTDDCQVSFTYEWDFDLYPVPASVIINKVTYKLYDTKTFCDYRHMYQCVVFVSDAEQIMKSGRDAVSEILKSLTMQRLDLYELLEKIRLR